MFVDWHQVNGGLHLLVDLFSNNLRRHVELSLIEALEKRLIDVTVHIIRCALEGTSLIDCKCCGLMFLDNSVSFDSSYDAASLASSYSVPSSADTMAASSVSSQRWHVAWSWRVAF